MEVVVGDLDSVNSRALDAAIAAGATVVTVGAKASVAVNAARIADRMLQLERDLGAATRPSQR